MLAVVLDMVSLQRQLGPEEEIQMLTKPSPTTGEDIPHGRMHTELVYIDAIGLIYSTNSSVVSAAERIFLAS